MSNQESPANSAPLPFDEAMLSGYVDGELTQAESQRVRIFLEDHPESRHVVDEIRRIRQAARSTTFKVPGDSQWDERPRGLLSLVLRNFGGVAVLAVVCVVTLLGLWQLAASQLPLALKVLAFGGLLGLSSLFSSVLVDRLKAAATDRYRRVLK